jgi:peptidyl-prolyl cis-trans isomerase A (cyclophilin A)/peptidyl-prolyl cis-trans isomerase B (cyclophilin B)
MLTRNSELPKLKIRRELVGSLLAIVLSTSSVQAGDTKVVMETSSGDVTLELDQSHAPRPVQNFLRYVAEHHFDGTVVYRVVPGFVIQAGSYESDGRYRDVHEPIPLEANNGLSNLRGTIAMARTDPDTATAEFFINLADNHSLDHHADDSGNSTGYAVFGRVVSGMEVVDRIAAAPVGGVGPFPSQAPIKPIAILRISVVP